MDESKILSTEEVDELLKAVQEKETDLAKLLHNSGGPKDIEHTVNYKALANVIELTWSECEKVFSSFIRKKVNVKPKGAQLGKLSYCLEGKIEKHVFGVFHLTTTNDFCLVVIALPLLHQMINALYGGVMNSKEPIIEYPGNIGLIVAEKICELALEGFCIACKEYGTVNFERTKTVTLPNLISKLSMEDDIYALTYTTTMGEVESDLAFMLPVQFLHKFLPINNIQDEERLKQNHAWRDVIKNQVIDSDITVVASLPELILKTKDIVAMKSGDLIPIGDPTVVDVYLNDVKLFCANAAQANSNRIIKILSES